MNLRKKILIILTDAGGGHRAPATAIADILAEQKPHLEVKLVNVYKEVLSSLDYVKKIFNFSGEDVYNLALKKNLSWLCWPILYPLMQLSFKLNSAKSINLLAEFFKKEQPDLVLSVTPYINSSLFQGLRRYSPTVPLVTLVTDLDQCVNKMWFNPAQDQYYICGTDRLYEQALSLGIKPNKVFKTSGMVVHQRFYEELNSDVAAERLKLKLKPDFVTFLISFGGHGSSEMLQIAKKLTTLPRCNFQVIFICGHNNKLYESLTKLQTNYPKAVLGFVSEMPYFMHIADLFIGKPGTGSISEAIVKKLPIIIKSNKLTMKQEKYAEKYLHNLNAGISLTSFKNLHQTLYKMSYDGKISDHKNALAKNNNRAIFEVVDILSNLIY